MKNIQTKNKQLRSGFTLFYALLVTSLLLALGLAVFNITLKELLLSSDARESQNAFYAADAALECALYWDRGVASAFGFYGDSLASGIQAIWPFDEGEGDTVYDYGRLLNDHGTLLGVDPSDGPDRVAGVSGEALEFDGVGDYVELNETIGFSGPFTISLWVRPALAFVTSSELVLAGTYGRLGFHHNATTDVPEYRVAIESSFSDLAMSKPINDGWHHLVLRRDENDAVDLFVDGGNTDTISVGKKAGTFDFQFIGQNSSGANFYPGSVDDVRAYNRALSDEEIELLYEGKTNPTFSGPYPEDSSIMCAGMDISSSDPDQGPGLTTWVTEETPGVSATTTFDVEFSNGRCALVEVAKDTSTTTIVSRGYNTCDEGDSRRVERALRATY